MSNNNLTDERLSALIRVARDSLELYEMELPVIDDVMLALAELQQRRAAMLQSKAEKAESVTTIQAAPALDVSSKNAESVTTIKPVADLYSIAIPGGRSTTYSTDAAEASDCRIMGWKVQEYVKLERYQTAMLGAEPAATLKPAIFIDGSISPDDADKLADTISKLNSEHRESQQMIAEPVSQPYTLRDGLAAIRNLGPIDAEKIQAERDALNEPVHEWIPCSERMPIENDIVLVVDDGYFVCEAQYREGDFFSAARGKGEFFETTCRDVELWMPLPAAPQQEVATDNTTQQFESLGLIATSDERKMELPRCSKHPETELQVHPFEQLLSYPPQPVMYCPLCRPSVTKWVEFDKQLRQWKGVK